MSILERGQRLVVVIGPTACTTGIHIAFLSFEQTISRGWPRDQESTAPIEVPKLKRASGVELDLLLALLARLLKHLQMISASIERQAVVASMVQLPRSSTDVMK